MSNNGREMTPEEFEAMLEDHRALGDFGDIKEQFDRALAPLDHVDAGDRIDDFMSKLNGSVKVGEGWDGSRLKDPDASEKLRKIATTPVVLHGKVKAGDF